MKNGMYLNSRDPQWNSNRLLMAQISWTPQRILFSMASQPYTAFEL